MKDTDTPITDTPVELPVITQDPVATEHVRHSKQAYGMMVVASAMAGGYREDGKHGPIVTAAKLFCILFAFLVPSLLMIDVALD